MGFFSDIAPRRAVRDFYRYVRQDRPYKALFALAATIPPLLLVVGFILDGNAKSKPPPPEVIYIESWPLSRSEADVLRDQKIRQDQKAAALARRQEAYRTLGRALGLDMKAIEADATRIRKQAQEDAQRQPDYGGRPPP